MTRASRAAWALAALAVLLLVGSLTGEGQGLFGTGIFQSPAWSWAFLIGGGSLALALLLSRLPKEQATS